MARTSNSPTKKQLIFQFMESNPKAEFPEVKAHFSDMNDNSLRAYFSTWRSEKTGGRKARRANAPKQAISSKDQKLILVFKKVIERQDKQIEALGEKLSEVKKDKKQVEGRLIKMISDLSAKQQKEVFQLVETFVKGLKA